MLQLSPLDQDAVAATLAYEPDVGTKTYDAPAAAAARMRLGKGEPVTDTKLDDRA